MESVGTRTGRALDAVIMRGYLEPVVVGLLAVAILAAHAAFAGGWTSVALDTAVLLAAALTGRWPTGAGVALAFALVGYLLAPETWPTLGEYAPLLVVLCFGVRGRLRHRAVLAPIYLVLLGAIQVQALPEGEPPLPYLVLWTVLLGGAWLVGSAWHALLLATEEARLRTALQERHDLARDLHDTVADALTALAMRAEQMAAEGGGVLAGELTELATEAARAIDGLRRIVDLLRQDDAARPAGPAPSVQVLVEDAAARLHQRGFSPRVSLDDDLPNLPGLIAHHLARLIEEATNNILRHGDPGGETAIVVEAADGVLGLAFVNGLRSRPRRQPIAPNLGLIGMRERAITLGGSVTSTRSEDRWLTSFEIPYRVTSPEPADP